MESSGNRQMFSRNRQITSCPNTLNSSRKPMLYPPRPARAPFDRAPSSARVRRERLFIYRMSGCFRLRSSRLSACTPLFPLADRRPKQMSQFHLNCLARIHKLVLNHHFRVKFTTSKMDKENYRIIFTK
jgi:hypothetical protein